MGRRASSATTAPSPPWRSPFLEAGEHRGLVAGLDMDDTAGQQPRLGQRWGEEILPGDAPEHLAPGACCNAGGEERRGGPIDRPVAASCHLMQRPERQSASRQHLVDTGNAERKHRTMARRPAFEARDSLAKRSDSRAGGRLTHG